MKEISAALGNTAAVACVLGGSAGGRRWRRPLRSVTVIVVKLLCANPDDRPIERRDG
jgi:hypothetical protein